MQHDYVLANASGAAYRADANDLAEAIATWNSGSSYPGTTFPRMRVVNTTLGIVARRNIANSGWLIESTDDETRVVSRAANTILDVSDITKVFRATANYTQTFDAVATLGDWWHCGYIIDAGVTITFDPSGSETIDGVTSKAFTGPASGFIYGNGSALFTIGFIGTASQTEQEAASSNTAMVTPATQKYHPSAVKAWLKLAGAGNSIDASYNVSSVTDNGTGDWTVNFTTAFSSANYGMATTVNRLGFAVTLTPINQVAGSCRFDCLNVDTAALSDNNGSYAIFTGDQ